VLAGLPATQVTVPERAPADLQVTPVKVPERAPAKLLWEGRESKDHSLNVRFGYENQVAFTGTVMVSQQLSDEQPPAVRLGDSEIKIAGVDPDLIVSTGSLASEFVGGSWRVSL